MKGGDSRAEKGGGKAQWGVYLVLTMGVHQFFQFFCGAHLVRCGEQWLVRRRVRRGVEGCDGERLEHIGEVARDMEERTVDG